VIGSEMKMDDRCSEKNRDPIYCSVHDFIPETVFFNRGSIWICKSMTDFSGKIDDLYESKKRVSFFKNDTR